ncbi:MAG TPA: sigma-54 dependent transcriptional regulator [Longimicrobiales bacterium]
MSHRIMVVDDEPTVRYTFDRYLTRAGHQVLAVETAEEALNRIAAFEPELVITDVRMPGMSGLQLLEKLRSSLPEVDVLVMTGFEDMQSAISAIKAGAYDYLVKPLEFDQIDAVVTRCFNDRAVRRRMKHLAREAAEPYALNRLVGRDPRMIEVYKMIGQLSQTRAPVLIRGETGTGKEVIARAIHFNSPEAAEPFVGINCTALPETLLESELFGHVRGSFTGAVGDRKGRFEIAGSGTIFLDEIGDTSLAFQAKLLRVLQEREFYAVGSDTPKRTDARVIAATHRDMEDLVERGQFREDLYFRLKVVEIVVPPLRERRGDIPILAEHLVDKIARETHKEVRIIPDDVMTRLMEYDWPGNVRELENALTRAIVLSRGPAISPEHIEAGESGGRGSSDPFTPENDSLNALEKAHVQRILSRTGGNKQETARILGISRPRLYRMIEKYRLSS